ncbi:MAG: hypothetical protein AVDCRST_MAG96-2829 [uncultured Segetibacter sp.]|uniref:Uncharacterized protein n=1 Tax=uncultured Segetibacter sp. TaxID=481133 RepID=A0A6J4TCB5_9BACT|nr:MAG: hypothetical protein AVDCRST_MAG96-2829 [uncultured Segetibacter sp.]
MSPTTDETGYTQPTLKQLINARGNEWLSFTSVIGWIIKRSGEVLFKVEKYK